MPYRTLGSVDPVPERVVGSCERRARALLDSHRLNVPQRKRPEDVSEDLKAFQQVFDEFHLRAWEATHKRLEHRVAEARKSDELIARLRKDIEKHERSIARYKAMSELPWWKQLLMSLRWLLPWPW